MDEEQRERFKRAVDRKAGPTGESAAESQDSFSEREKASRHGKVTADKWNQ